MSDIGRIVNQAGLFEGGEGQFTVYFIGIAEVEFHNPFQVMKALFVHRCEADGGFLSRNT